MDTQKNYYRILQVSEDADDAVIAAAYRALTKRYHPDVKDTGDGKFMRVINEAYEVLSDPRLRAEYDRQRDRADDLRDEPRRSDENDEERVTWNLKSELYPEIKNEFDALASISPTLANTFKLSLVGARELEKHAQLANSLRIAYLTRYFGKARRLQEAGERLIKCGDREKAKELNHIVSALGADLSEDQVDRILRKLHLASRAESYEMRAPTGEGSANEQRSWWLLYAIIGLIGALWLLSVVAPKR